jgi:hypothetical protein
MIPQDQVNWVTHFRQRRGELDSAIRTNNRYQIGALLVAAIGSGIYLAVKLTPFSEWFATLASHPAVDLLLIVIIFCFWAASRGYSLASDLFLVKCILEDERLAATAKDGSATT